MKKGIYFITIAVYSFVILFLSQLSIIKDKNNIDSVVKLIKITDALLIIFGITALLLGILIFTKYIITIRADYKCVKKIIDSLNLDFKEAKLYKNMKLNGFGIAMKLATSLKNETDLFGEAKYSLYVTRGLIDDKLSYWISIFSYWDINHENPIVVTLDGDIYWPYDKNLFKYEPKQYICVGLGYECNIPIYICHREYFQQIGINELEELDI